MKLVNNGPLAQLDDAEHVPLNLEHSPKSQEEASERATAELEQAVHAKIAAWRAVFGNSEIVRAAEKWVDRASSASGIR